MPGEIRCVRCRQVYLVPNGAPGLESLTVSAIKDWINDHDCEPVRQLSIFDALGVVS